MKRRTLIGMGVGALAGPLSAPAQPAGKLARVGYLGNSNPNATPLWLEGFRQGLRELGWIDGQNIGFEYRWADGHVDRLPALAAELVQRPVDVILTAGTNAVRAARQATGVLPIVAAIMGDPVAAGLAASLARPGGNVTGLANLFEVLTPKQLQIFKETMPRATRIAILSRPELAPALPSLQSVVEAAARRLGLDPRVFQIGEPADLDAAFSAAKAARADGVHVLPAPFFNQHRARIAELAARHGLPSISESRGYVQDGGLMSFGPNFASMFGRAASYVDRILKGARPGDLPIEQPTKFELVINMRTAKALGVKIPQSVLLRADEVIE